MNLELSNSPVIMLRAHLQNGLRGVQMKNLIRILKTKGEVWEVSVVDFGDLERVEPIARLRMLRSAAFNMKKQQDYDTGAVSG